MKKLFCVLLSLSIIFTFAACGKDKKDDDGKNSVDIEYYAKLGSIPECSYKLGADIDGITGDLTEADKAAAEKGENYVFAVTEGEKSVRIDNGSFVYYYEKDKKDNGVSYIVALDTAYGFSAGTSILDVKSALADLDFTEEELTADDAFFLFDFTEGTALKCTFENRVVMFAFVENGLAAAVVYDTDNWTF